MSVSLGQGPGPESSASGNTQGDTNRNGEGGEWLDERVAAISAEIAAAIAQAQAQAQEQIIEEEEESSSEEEIEGDEGEGEETNAENGDMEMRRGSNTAGIVNERNIIVNISGIRSSREEEDDDEDNPFGDRNAIKTPGIEKAGYSWYVSHLSSMFRASH